MRARYAVPIPGTTVTARLGTLGDDDYWVYTLWADDTDLLAAGALDLRGIAVTPEQVARVAFLLDVEYPLKARGIS